MSHNSVGPKACIRDIFISSPFATPYSLGVRGSVVVKALCYKPEGRGFETR
jgi:hypothetical protein